MWFAVGMITVVMSTSSGTYLGVTSVRVSEKFDTLQQCAQYKEGVVGALPDKAKRHSFINCIKVENK